MNIYEMIKELAEELGYRFSNDIEAELKYIKSQAGHDIDDENEVRRNRGEMPLRGDEVKPYYVRAIKESFAFWMALRINYFTR